MSKYELNSAEERYQPGSGDLVLANKLGITDDEEMETLESGLLLMLYERLFIEGQPPSVLAFEHVSGWHRQWLGNVYDWAGKLRHANLAKDGFKFAAADRIPLLLDSFDKQFLSRSAELKFLVRPELVRYLAECHVEFILIHPSEKVTGVFHDCFVMYCRLWRVRAYWITVYGMSTRPFISEQYRQAYQETIAL
ncbi:Adenosine monophosphate-protein transferase VbhT [Klebsiella oxytoca]|nr:Adenosine monophosphate-protein transferase VbhT [Klebsiella oxytoca]